MFKSNNHFGINHIYIIIRTLVKKAYLLVELFWLIVENISGK